MSWDGQERRRKKRYGIRNSTLRFKKAGLFSFLAPASPKHLLLNFNELGCHFIAKEIIEPGSVIDVQLEAPKVKGAAHAKGKVIWSRKSDQLDAYHVGVEFTGVSGRSKHVLKLMLDGALLENVDISTRVYMKEIEKL